VGLTFILKYATILNTSRQYVTQCALLKELFKCSLCLGFWSGVVIFVIGSSHYHLLPFASAGASWISDNFNNVLQSVEIVIDDKINRESKNAK
jgi:hypothetical protein